MLLYLRTQAEKLTSCACVTFFSLRFIIFYRFKKNIPIKTDFMSILVLQSLSAPD